MLTDIVTSFNTACTTLSKSFLFGTMSEDLNKYSQEITELIFLHTPFNGTATPELIKTGGGHIGYTLDIYCIRSNSQATQQTTTKQAQWDACLTAILAVTKEVCANNRNFKASIQESSAPLNDYVRFGTQMGITTKITLTLNNYWQCS